MLHGCIKEVQPTILSAPPDFWLSSYHVRASTTHTHDTTAHARD